MSGSAASRACSTAEAALERDTERDLTTLTPRMTPRDDTTVTPRMTPRDGTNVLYNLVVLLKDDEIGIETSRKDVKKTPR